MLPSNCERGCVHGYLGTDEIPKIKPLTLVDIWTFISFKYLVGDEHGVEPCPCSKNFLEVEPCA